MRHRVKKHLRLSGKDKAHRKSVVRSLITGLFENKSIVTTEKRALAVEPVSHKLIELVKSGQTDYNKIRAIAPEVHTESASQAILAMADTYKDRKGGYTRITPIKYRDGDGALLVKLELV